jgi:hypothetical protein
LADKSTSLILEALSRAVADPGGMPLHGNKKAPGLFAATATARQLAQRCKEEGLLRVVLGDGRGKNVGERCALTEKGIDFLLSQLSPKQVLEDLVRTLQEQQTQVGELVATARQWQAGLEALTTYVEKVLRESQRPKLANGTAGMPALSGNGSEAWLAMVNTVLSQWHDIAAGTDCPLPELFRKARDANAPLTIGHFHDGLRQLHEQERIYLHPWTGPLYEIPEPAYALLLGHEVVYYASTRQ